MKKLFIPSVLFFLTLFFRGERIIANEKDKDLFLENLLKVSEETSSLVKKESDEVKKKVDAIKPVTLEPLWSIINILSPAYDVMQFMAPEIVLKEHNNEVMNIIRKKYEEFSSFTPDLSRLRPFLTETKNQDFSSLPEGDFYVIMPDMHGDLAQFLKFIFSTGMFEWKDPQQLWITNINYKNKTGKDIELHRLLPNIQLKEGACRSHIKLISLGDLIDRGAFGVEIMFTLFNIWDEIELKCGEKKQDLFRMAMGNHDFYFYADCFHKGQDLTRTITNGYGPTFRPTLSSTSERSLACHYLGEYIAKDVIQGSILYDNVIFTHISQYGTHIPRRQMPVNKYPKEVMTTKIHKVNAELKKCRDDSCKVSFWNGPLAFGGSGKVFYAPIYTDYSVICGHSHGFYSADVEDNGRLTLNRECPNIIDLDFDFSYKCHGTRFKDLIDTEKEVIFLDRKGLYTLKVLP